MKIVWGIGPTRMRRTHLVTGFLFAAVFAGTGAYMRFTFPEAFQGDAGMRMMYRASHIYILLSAIVNLAVGAQRALCPAGWRRKLQTFGSVCVLLAPAVFTASFFFVPVPGKLARPIVLAGVILCVAGSGAAVLAGRAEPGATR